MWAFMTGNNSYVGELALWAIQGAATVLAVSFAILGVL